MKIVIRKKKKGDTSRIGYAEMFFFIALFFYCADYYYSCSLYDLVFPAAISKVFKLACVLFLGLRWLFAGKITAKRFVYSSLVVAATLFIAVLNDYSKLVYFVLLIVSGFRIDFDKIIKWIFIYTCVWTFIIFMGCKAGIIPDYTFVHRIGSLKRTAHSYGFGYYSWIGFIFMSITMMWIYLRKKLPLIEAVILAAINIYMFYIHTTVLPLGMTLAYIFVVYFALNFKFLQPKHTFFRVLATILPLGLCGFTMLGVFVYMNDKLHITWDFLNTIVMRFEYSAQAVAEYGVSLFGSHIIQYGNTAKVYGDASTAFYIDSGYVHSVLAYGIIFTVLALILYTMLFRYLSETNNIILYYWFAVVICGCCINNFMFDILNNPVVFLLPIVVFDAGRKAKGRRIKLVFNRAIV